MKNFNLSEWALNHRSLLWYFMIVFSLAGLASYFNLGREEDPQFAIKTMVISAQWPGASTEETMQQVTERIEKKLEELSSLDFTRSMTVAGQTTIFVNLKDTTRGREVDATWLRIRNMISDIRGELPQTVIGPFYNDRFGDVFGNIYAFTSDGLTRRQLRDYVEKVRTAALTVPNVGKVDILGAEDEVIFIEFSTRQLAAYGIDQQTVINALKSQNAVTPSGVIQAGSERINIRVGGSFSSEEALRNINIKAGDRFFRLSDIAQISRGYSDPPSQQFRFNGEPAIGLAIGMKQGANLLKFGEALEKEMKRIEAELPIGVGLHRVADQPHIVEQAVSGFTKALFEAVAIVLVVSFISLGWRAGMVVAISIPLVLAMTFIFMEYLDISLQRISLGALIIALGLLVDDAMIAVEMMVARLEMGDSLRKAATYVYTSTAFPMLTGTLVTVAGFIPVGLNSSSAGEFTFTLFVVIGVSLVLSWIVAVIFTPLLGVLLLPEKLKAHHQEKGRLSKAFSAMLLACMQWRWVTIGVTVGLFALSIMGLGLVQQQFFPSSDRSELAIDWNLSQNASITETRSQMVKFEQDMLKGNPDIVSWSSYIGSSAVRFVLSHDVQPSSPAIGQMIIVTKDVDARQRLKPKFEAYLRQTFLNTDAFVKTLDLGPPVGRPVQYRISGPDINKLRDMALDLAATISQNKHLGPVTYDWNEPSRVIRVDVLQDKARQLGISSENIATLLNNIIGGTTATQIRDDIYLINVVGRAIPEERTSVETLRNLQIVLPDGRSIPLATVANFRYDIETPIVWRRSRIPTITVRAAIIDSVQPATAVKELEPSVQAFREKLPAGYQVVTGGSVEESAKSQGPIAAAAPLMIFVMATILMLQLQSFSRLFLVFAVAPLALIGVVLALLTSGAPLGFVAILGVLALIGILIRNSVILIDQIEHLRQEGMEAWAAVFNATEQRMRPIMLTAAAASLALIPIAGQIFWGPMALAMMGGIIVGTVLTLLFLPALYVAWFRIRQPQAGDSAEVKA